MHKLVLLFTLLCISGVALCDELGIADLARKMPIGTFGKPLGTKVTLTGTAPKVGMLIPNPLGPCSHVASSNASVAQLDGGFNVPLKYRQSAPSAMTLRTPAPLVTVSVQVWVFEPAWFVARSEMLNCPVVVGTPPMAPLDGLMESQLGALTRLHVIGWVPLADGT